MAWIIDAVVIGLIIFFMLFGAHRGALKTILGLCGTLVSFIVSVFLVYVLGNKLLAASAINNLVLGESGSLYSVLLGKLPNFNGAVVGAPETDLESLLSGIMGVLVPVFSKLLSGLEGGVYNGQLISVAMAKILSKAIYYSILSVAIFIVLRIIIGIITHAINKMREKKAIKKVDRFFGLWVGMVIGVAVVVVLMFGVSLLSSFKFMAPFNNLIENTYVTKWAMDVMEALIKYFKLDAWMAKWLGAVKGAAAQNIVSFFSF